MEISIRHADKNDIPAILGLLYELGRPKPEKDVDVDKYRKKIEKYIADTNMAILVAKIGNVGIVGMASVILLDRLNQQTLEMYIPEIIVSEKYQNMGIGTKMMDSCQDMARKKKCHRIRLESGNRRKMSHKFYKNKGFVQNSLSFAKSP